MSELVGNGSEDRWYPISVQKIKKHLNTYEVNPDKCPEQAFIIANISYNIQYLEYIRKTLNELNLSTVLQTQSLKSFIVISVSIVEAILYLVSCNEDLRKKVHWKNGLIVSSSVRKIFGKSVKIEVVMSERLEKPEFEVLSLDSLLKKIERKKLLKQDTQFFRDLNHLRKLRNKIHLQETSQTGKTDWHSFWTPEYRLAKNNLKKLLLDPIFSGEGRSDELFDFL